MITKTEATERALAFLAEHETGSLATATPGGRPYSSTVYFAYDPDFTFYFVTSHHSDKFNNINLNNLVSFSVGTGPEYRELVIHGHAKQVDVTERDSLLEAIEARVSSSPNSWPVHAIKKMSDGGSVIYRVTPDEVIYLDLTSEDQLESPTKYFYQLLP